MKKQSCIQEVTTEKQDVLTYEEIRKLAHLFAELGIRKIKLTGGEPLLRKDVAEITAMLKKECHMESVTLTTNGVLLSERLEELLQAGIDGINISLDTTDRERYDKITGADCLEKVKQAVRYCMMREQLNVKINCVLMDQEKNEILELIELAKKNKIAVRFIEQMPIGHTGIFKKWDEDAVKSLLEENNLHLEPVHSIQGNGPAHYYKIAGYHGEVGFISALSHKFCSSCNRVRLTADGFLKPCLQYSQGIHIGKMLRDGMTSDEISEQMKQCIYEKPRSHHFEKADNGGIETENMAEIGG